MPDDQQPKKNFFTFMKDYIALAIVIFSFAVVIILIVQAFQLSDKDVSFKNTKDIIGFFLPVVGTWMGTILTFYFTKENFESASRSMQETIKKLTSEDKLKATKATEVMIEVAKIDRYQLMQEGDLGFCSHS